MKEIPQAWQISAKGLWESYQSGEIVFHPHDKKYLIIKNANELWEVSGKDFAARRIIKERDEILKANYSPDGKKIYYSVSDNAIAIINSDGTNWKLIRVCAPLDETELCFSADSKFLFCFSRFYQLFSNRFYIYQLDPNTPLPDMPDKI